MAPDAPKSKLSLDVWAVLFALLLALIVRVGGIQAVPW